MTAFFETIEDDPRITTAHISVYLAMLSEFQAAGACDLLLLNRTRIMQLAKISARSTYDRVIHDLDVFGYIQYHPDFGGNSTIKFNKL
ncbi:MAG: hypothetical protein J0H85_09065 [Sediminibacterium magnilacihabitans]|nr:hypothetical protein [Sediminibacterium magnilacihabitans]